MKRLILYPEVKIQGIDFSKEKVVVVPDQSMSLHEIIKRFTRRESLPVQREGFYESRFDDLSKYHALDYTEKEDYIATVREYGDRLRTFFDKDVPVPAQPVEDVKPA